MKLSANFSLAEAIKSQTALRCGIDNNPNDDQIACLKAVAEKILQPAREHFGTPFTPSSWFRSPALCTQIGSKTTSQHAKGQAADFEVPGVSNYDLAKWVTETLDFDQLILEHWNAADPAAGWVHCSYAGPDQNRKEILRYDGSAYRQGLRD